MIFQLDQGVFRRWRGTLYEDNLPCYTITSWNRVKVERGCQGYVFGSLGWSPG